MAKIKLAGRKICVRNRKVLPCCGQQGGGPCCSYGQDCTIIDNGTGNWTHTLETHFDATISIPSSAFQDGSPGTSPAFSTAFSVATRKTLTDLGLTHCAATSQHAYSVGRDFDGPNSFDPGNVIVSNVIAPTIGYADQNAFPNAGCQSSFMGADLRLGLASISPVAHVGVLLAGTPQSSGVRATLNVTLGQEEYIASNSNGNFKGPESPGFGFAVEVYADGTFAAWDNYPSAGTSSLSVTPNYIGACLAGATVSFSLGRPAFVAFGTFVTQQCTGTVSVAWTAGVGKCGDPPLPIDDDFPIDGFVFLLRNMR